MLSKPFLYPKKYHHCPNLPLCGTCLLLSLGILNKGMRTFLYGNSNLFYIFIILKWEKSCISYKRKRPLLLHSATAQKLLTKIYGTSYPSSSMCVMKLWPFFWFFGWPVARFRGIFPLTRLYYEGKWCAIAKSTKCNLGPKNHLWKYQDIYIF